MIRSSSSGVTIRKTDDFGADSEHQYQRMRFHVTAGSTIIHRADN